MVIMALDHVRDYFSIATFDPVDLSKTDLPFFFTRWITHYCAPTFIFLAGVSAFLFGQKVDDKKKLFKFLITRGLWIVFLEFTIVRFGWFFNFDYSFSVAQVIWAIGWSMVVLSGLIFLPWRVVGIIGLAIIVFHNLLDPIIPSSFGSMDWAWKILHEGGPIQVSNSLVYVAYPLLPWIGVMAAGYGFGSLFLLPEKKRINTFLKIGSGLIISFIIIRSINFYGDASLWAHQQSLTFTILSFLNCTKYPPSLLYLLMTLGPAILLLAWFEKIKGWFAVFFVTIGKVPMFYYVCHLLLIHSLIVLDAAIHDFNTDYLFSSKAPWMAKERYGYGLPGVYMAWLIVVGILFPLCSWFVSVKQRNKDKWWVSYV